MLLLEINANLDHLERWLQAVDARPLLKLIGSRVLSFIDRQFKTQGSAGGTAWAPLRPSTLAQRRHGGSTILQDTGQLKQSFAFEVEGEQSVWIGTRVKHAEYHEYGTKPYTIKTVRAKVLAAQLRAGGFAHFGKSVHHPGLPARPMLPSQSMAESFIASEVVNYQENIVGAS